MANFSDFDLEMTRRALELAKQGIGQVSPNPLVGCVIVDKDGNVVGEGSYIYDNVVHAEVIALEKAGEKAKGGTAYISLEPHAHTGRTPPCTDALIRAGIKRVVCPIEDPNPLVSGRGFEVLRQNGIEVTTGILAKEAYKLNEKFFVWHRKNRPFVQLKMALSLDGRISVNRSVSTSLSNQESLKRVHNLRHEHDAILVGSNTVIIDDPMLTDRSSKPRRRKLVRVILDNRLRVSCKNRIVATAREFPTLVITSSKDKRKIELLTEKGVKVFLQDTYDLSEVLKILYSLEIQSILVEGGAKVAGAFLKSRLVDKVTFIFSPIIIGSNCAPVAVEGCEVKSLEKAFRLKELSLERYGDDFEITGYPLSN